MRIPNDAKRAIAEGGVIYMGIDIPAAWTEAAPGSTWDVTSSPIEGGHCVIACGYDEDGLDIISWGFHFRMTWKAWADYVSEAYMLLDSAWIKATGVTPFDMPEPELAQAMQSLKKAA